MSRCDETWHRLREWTNGQAPSERLAAQILINEKFSDVDPSHPLGGKDGKKDALCARDGKRWVLAVYFPRGQQSFGAIKKKFLSDLEGVKENGADALAFVTNQELSLGERKELTQAAAPTGVELYHLERLTIILDAPGMAEIRQQFLNIDATDQGVDRLASRMERLESLQTGGNTFCHWMLYHFDIDRHIAKDFVIIRKGEYPLYDVRLRITDLDRLRDIYQQNWGEINSAAVYQHPKWQLPENVYYRAFFFARNGSWHQDLVLRLSRESKYWLAATRVIGIKGEVLFEQYDNSFIAIFGQVEWRA